MARIESIQLPFTHAGLDKVVQLYRTKLNLRYKSFVAENEDSQGYLMIAQEGDFPAATEINQGTGVAFEDFKLGPYKQILPVKRGIGFAVAHEVIESDVAGLIKKRAPKMARAMARTKEADLANHMNLATGTQVTPPDGAALAGTHNYDGGSFSNIIGSPDGNANPALSIGALEMAIADMSLQPSQEGDYIGFDGPYTLLVHPSLWGLARRLVESDKFPTTFNNDPNVAKGMIKDVVVNPFFTSPTAWALVITGDDENPLRCWNRRAPTLKEEEDITRDLQLVVLTEIWARYLTDWRGFEYSAGQ